MNDERLLEELQQVASTLRLEGELAVPELPDRHVRRSPRWGWRAWSGVGVAAALLMAGLLWLVGGTIPDASPYSWQSVEGLVGLSKSEQVGTPIPFGEEIRVQEEGKVSFSIGRIGSVALGPGSRLTVMPPLDPVGDGRYRLGFEEGEVEVFVDAPARAFLVQTPWFDVWDLGCRYTIVLDAEGNGSLAVDIGAVRCEGEGFAIDVPAGKGLTFLRGQPSSSEPR